MAGRTLPFPPENELRIGEALPAARVVAGVDEAGLGPMLGPLTIGWSALRTGGRAIDPWIELGDAISRDPRRDEGRIVVADSKVVFTRNPRGERRLETTALAFLALNDPSRRWPRTGRELLARLGADLPPEMPLEREPWFPHLAERLPLSTDAGELEGLVARLDREAARHGIEVVDLGARVLPVGELNRSFEATGNKGRTLWEKCAPVLLRLWSRLGSEGLDLVVDRHGGRKRYGELLGGTLGDARVTTVAEARVRSEYTACGVCASSDGRSMRVAFAEKADGSSFTVALASCLAKYAREVCMRAFNDCFGALEPALRPTAGYVTDARRWLAEARAAIERLGIPRSELVRER